MEPRSRLDGQVALVTGGTGGIGQSIVRALAAQGADIGLLHIGDIEAAEQLAQEVREGGRDAYLVQQDLSQLDSLHDCVERFVADADRLDILVNCAGIAEICKFDAVTIPQMERIIRVNAMAPFFLSQRAAEFMIEQGDGGRIVNITSTNATVGEGALVSYNASKGALEMITKSLAIDLAPHRITVNSVAPGLVKTGIVSWPQGFWDCAQQNIPLGRPVEPKEVAAAVCFLASPDAGSITGQSIIVDGGLVAEQFPGIRLFADEF